MSFEAFIESAWNEHADQTRAVADRLQSSLHIVASAAQIGPYAQLVTHVFGEHQGRWDQGVALLQSLRALPSCDSAAAAALDRGIAALRYCDNDDAALAALAVEDRIAALATAAAALAGRHAFDAALAAYDRALALAAAGLPPGCAAHRALAVGGNNLASALEESRERSADQTAGMVRAAEGGLMFWRLAGTWLEEERAEYRLARSLLLADRAADAVQHAQRCVDICASHDAPAFERFFGHAVLALTQRAAGDARASAASRDLALQHHARIPADEQVWCKTDLHALGT